jgi:hypothetical protein
MIVFAEYVFHDDYDYVPGARKSHGNALTSGVLATGDTTGYAAHGESRPDPSNL